MDPETVQAVQQAFNQLAETNSALRADAVRKLGEMGIAHPKILEQLQEMAQNDPDEGVRAAAQQSVDMLKSRKEEPSQAESPVIVPANNAHPTQIEAILALLQRQNQVLDQIAMNLTYGMETESKTKYNLRAHITDIDMSIGAMVSFMFKWMVATIPVVIVVGVIYFVLFMIISAMSIYR